MSECLYDWLGCHWEKETVVAIDRKTIRGSKSESQKAIVQKIREKKADYVIGLKGNQPTLHFQEFSAELPCKITADMDHGRIEKREYRLPTDLFWLPERGERAGLKAVGSVRSTATRNGTTSVGTRFFVTFLTEIDRFSYAVRRHCSIENQIHWALDVIFDEDSSRARKDMSPINLNVLRKTALALCIHAGFGPRVSMKRKRFSAALDPNRFLDILFAIV